LNERSSRFFLKNRTKKRLRNGFRTCAVAGETMAEVGVGTSWCSISFSTCFRRQACERNSKQAIILLSFSYGCPEPVLVSESSLCRYCARGRRHTKRRALVSLLTWLLQHQSVSPAICWSKPTQRSWCQATESSVQYVHPTQAYTQNASLFLNCCLRLSRACLGEMSKTDVLV
jgi:hypothetical protein